MPPVLNRTTSPTVGGPSGLNPGNPASPLSVFGSLFGAQGQQYANTQAGLANVMRNYGQGASAITGGFGALGANTNAAYRGLYGQQAGMLGLNKPGSWGVYAPAAQMIQRNLAQQTANVQTGLINSGLGNSTVVGQMQRGPQLDAQLALGSLASQRAQLGASLMGQDFGAGIQAQYGAGMAGLGFAGQALNNQAQMGMQGMGMLNQQALAPYGMYGSFIGPALQQQQMAQQMQLAAMQRGQPQQAGGPGPGFTAGGGLGPNVGFYQPGYPSNYGSGISPHGGSGSGFSGNYGSGMGGLTPGGGQSVFDTAGGETFYPANPWAGGNAGGSWEPGGDWAGSGGGGGSWEGA